MDNENVKIKQSHKTLQLNTPKRMYYNTIDAIDDLAPLFMFLSLAALSVTTYANTINDTKTTIPNLMLNVIMFCSLWMAGRKAYTSLKELKN